MSEYITLLGAEDVSRAGHNMQSAADTMNRAFGNFDESLRAHQRFMEEWLQTFERILSEYKP
jgi:hypothetical protein